MGSLEDKETSGEIVSGLARVYCAGPSVMWVRCELTEISRPTYQLYCYQLLTKTVYQRVSYQNVVTIIPVRATKTCEGSGYSLIFGTRWSGEHHAPPAFPSGKPHYTLTNLL